MDGQTAVAIIITQLAVAIHATLAIHAVMVMVIMIGIKIYNQKQYNAGRDVARTIISTGIPSHR